MKPRSILQDLVGFLSMFDMSSKLLNIVRFAKVLMEVEDFEALAYLPYGFSLHFYNELRKKINEYFYRGNC